MFKQSVNWCFTDFELLDWGKIYEEDNDIGYICWGKEICPKTKKEHYNGWIQFETKKKKRIGGVKKMCHSKKIHVESCMGTVEQNDKYCKKDGDWKTLGAFTTQGTRTDLMELKKIIDEGGTLREVANNSFSDFIKYNTGFQKYKKMIDQSLRKCFRKVKVIHIHGKTGTGKTRKAMSYSDDTYKIQGNAMKWWDGYDGEETLVIDEYDSQIPCTEILGILDGYQLRLPIKGSFTYANWKNIIITSNYKKLHRNAKPMHRAALKRRITETIEMC